MLQEFVAAAADPLLGCGERWISSAGLNVFAHEIQGLYDYNIENLLERDPFEPLDSFLYFRASDPADLTELLWSTRRTSKATRPHDHVYALLGLVNEETRDAIPVDYRKKMNQLFKEVAAFCLGADRDLDMLYAASERGELELPSWVPDWTINQTHFSHLEAPSEKNYDAALGSKSSFKISEDLNVLTVEGYEVDTIIETDYNSTETRIWDIQQEAARIGSLLVSWAQKHFERDSVVDGRASWKSNLLDDVDDMLGHCQTVIPKYHYYDPRLRKLLEVFLKGFDPQYERPYRARGRLLDDVEGELRRFIRDFDLPMFATLLNRRLFVTRNGMIGLGTEALNIGDIVVVLLGGRVPFILRRIDHDEGSYKLVGDAFVLELMGQNFGPARPRPADLLRRWFHIV